MNYYIEISDTLLIEVLREMEWDGMAIDCILMNALKREQVLIDVL